MEAPGFEPLTLSIGSAFDWRANHSAARARVLSLVVHPWIDFKLMITKIKLDIYGLKECLNEHLQKTENSKVSRFFILLQISILVRVGKWVFILLKVAIWQLVMALMQYSKWRKNSLDIKQQNVRDKILACRAFSFKAFLS